MSTGSAPVPWAFRRQSIRCSEGAAAHSASGARHPRESVRRKIAALLERGDLIAARAGARVRPALLEDPRSAAFAQTLLREFARAGAQVADPSEPPAPPRPGDRNRVASG